MKQESVLTHIVQIATSLVSEIEIDKLIPILLGQSADFTHSDLACAYLSKNHWNSSDSMVQACVYGMAEVPQFLLNDSEFIEFLAECNKPVVSLTREHGFFESILLNEEMRSGIAMPLKAGSSLLGVFFFNSRNENHYRYHCLLYFDALIKLITVYFQNHSLKFQGSYE